VSRRIAALALCAAVALGAAAAEDDSPEEADGTTEESARAGSSVGASLQGQDGVRIQTMCTHCNSANIQVGGLAEDLVPVLRDGYPVFGGLATSVILSVLPQGTVADTQVARGPGDATAPAAAAGGVIRLAEADPSELPRFDLGMDGGSYDLFGGHARAAGTIAEGLAGSVTVGTAQADPVDDDGDGNVDVGAVERRYAEGRLAWKLSPRHTLDGGVSWIDEDTTEARGAIDVFGVLFPTDPDAGPRWTREDTFLERTEARLGWTWAMDGGRTLELRGLEAWRDQTVRSQIAADPDGPLGPEATALFERFAIREDHHWGGATFAQPVGFDGMLRFGVEGHEHRVRAATVEAFDLIQNPGGPPPDPEIGTDYAKTWTGFAEADWTLSPAWSLSAGLRYDDLTWGAVEEAVRRDDDQVSPRASVRWAPAAGWSVRILGGRTVRPPKPILAEVCCGQAYQRSYTARAESGTTLGVEAVYQPGPGLRASVYAARTDFDDHLIRLVGWSQVYTQTYTLGNVPEARAETLEAALRWKPHPRVQLDGSLGWLSFFNRGERDVPVLVTPPSRAQPVTVLVPMDRVPYRPMRTASLSVGWTVGRGVALSASGNYTGPMLIQQFADDPTSAQNILLPDLRRTPGFWLVGLSASVPVHHRVDVVAALDNLTDEIQDDLGDPTTDYNWGPLSGRAWRLSLRWHLD